MAFQVPGKKIVGLQIRNTTPITKKNFRKRFFPMTQRVPGILWNV